MTIKFANRSLAIFILIMNIYFLYASFEIIKTEGGPMGIALLALPYLFTLNLFIIPSIAVFFNNHHSKKSLLVLNIIGTIAICFFISLFI